MEILCRYYGTLREPTLPDEEDQGGKKSRQTMKVNYEIKKLKNITKKILSQPQLWLVYKPEQYTSWCINNRSRSPYHSYLLYNIDAFRDCTCWLKFRFPLQMMVVVWAVVGVSVLYLAVLVILMLRYTTFFTETHLYSINILSTQGTYKVSLPSLCSCLVYERFCPWTEGYKFFQIYHKAELTIYRHPCYDGGIFNFQFPNISWDR